MIIKDIDKKFDYFLYSEISENRKESTLKDLINRFCKEFQCPYVQHATHWRKRMDEICNVGGEDHERNVLIAYDQEIPAAVQQFSIRPSTKEAYDEGIFVDQVYRGRKLSISLCEELYLRLNKQNISSFSVGYVGNFDSAPVRKRSCSQKLAEKIITIHSDKIIEIVRTPKGKISRYKLDLQNF